MGEPAKYPSKERVVRDPYLVYAEGDDIPVTDVDELVRQGYIDGPDDLGKSEEPGDDKADAPAEDKAQRPAANKRRRA